MKKHQTKQDKSSLAYIREAYGVPSAFGERVWYDGRAGIITGGSGQYLIITFLGETKALGCYHPTCKMAYDREAAPNKHVKDTLGSMNRSDAYWTAQIAKIA